MLDSPIVDLRIKTETPSSDWCFLWCLRSRIAQVEHSKLWITFSRNTKNLTSYHDSMGNLSKNVREIKHWQGIDSTIYSSV